MKKTERYKKLYKGPIKSNAKTGTLIVPNPGGNNAVPLSGILS